MSTVNISADLNRIAATDLAVQRPPRERFGYANSVYGYSFIRDGKCVNKGRIFCCAPAVLILVGRR